MTTLKAVPPLITRAQKTTRTKLDTIVIDPGSVRAWKSPPFQRPLTINAKVKELALNIKQDDGVIPGVLTLGAIGKEVYLLDGQHRREAFLLSECPRGYADVRYHDMGEEFVNVNTPLVRLRPDDILRGLESSTQALLILRKALNLTLTAWLYRRLVVAPWSPKTPKLTREMFGKAIGSLSTESAYLEWLVGRNFTDRDRGPAYARMKKILAKRLGAELGKKVFLPNPSWDVS